MMGDEVQEFYKAALEVAKEAGERMKTDFYKKKNIEMKDNNFADLVTETDKFLEDLIMSRLSNKFPSHKFIGEETVAAGGKCELTDDPTWIVDPIDGTTNFIHGNAQSCVSIGLAINKEMVVGIINAPVRGELYTAVKGQGAFCNDEKLSVSKNTELSQSILIIQSGTTSDQHLMQARLRAYGSAAMSMCFVAAGSHEAFLEHGIHMWDIAAAKVIVEEAGGIVLDPSGEPTDMMDQRVLAACNMSIAQQISGLIQNITLGRD